MSYIVLARKWRPQKFEDVIGQEHVTRTLVNAIKQDRLGHAFIFAGPRGVGKTTTARLLAKAVNSETQAAAEPAGEKALLEKQSLDIIEIDGASNRGIDEIRNLRENVRFAPASSKFKIYIIDEVHMLSKEAFNALLKTLEEPPSHVIFIFATTEIHRVPLTILSRCQRFDFKRIGTRAITDHLQKIARQEKIKIDDESFLLIARKADGSMRDATSILDQLASFSKTKISLTDVQTSLGLINEDLFFEYSQLMLAKKDGDIIHFTQKIFQQGYDVINFIHGLEEHFRNLLVVQATGSAALLETSDIWKELYQKNTKLFNKKDLLHYLDILIQNESMLKFSENPQLIIELLLLKLAHKPLSVDIEELLKLLKHPPAASNTDPDTGAGTPPAKPSGSTGEGAGDKKQNKPGPGQLPSVSTSTTKGITSIVKEVATESQFKALKKLNFPQNQPDIKSQKPNTENPEPTHETKGTKCSPSEISLVEVTKQWGSTMALLKKEKKIILASSLQDGVPHKIEDQILKIAFEPKAAFNMNQVEKGKRVLEKILLQQFNTPLKVECINLDFEKQGIKKPLKTPEEAFEDIQDKEPVLKKIISMFDCENINEENIQ